MAVGVSLYIRLRRTVETDLPVSQLVSDGGGTWQVVSTAKGADTVVIVCYLVRKLRGAAMHGTPGIEVCGRGGDIVNVVESVGDGAVNVGPLGCTAAS